MRAKGHAFLRDLAQFVQAENLEAAGVGENRARPGHEAMQSAQLADLLHPRPQVKMVGVPQKNLDAELFQNVLRDAFDRGQGSDRHEDRSFDYAVRRGQAAGASRAGSSFDLKRDGQRWDCSNRASTRQQPQDTEVLHEGGHLLWDSFENFVSFVVDALLKPPSTEWARPW